MNLDLFNELIWDNEYKRMAIKFVGGTVVTVLTYKSLKSVYYHFKYGSKHQALVNDHKLRLFQKLEAMKLPLDNIENICYNLTTADISIKIRDGSLKAVDVLEAFQANSLIKDKQSDKRGFIDEVVYNADVQALMLDESLSDDTFKDDEKCILGWPMCIDNEINTLNSFNLIKDAIKNGGGIIIFISKPKSSIINSIRSRSAISCLCIDDCVDLFQFSDMLHVCLKAGLCSFRPTTTRYPIAIQGCLNIIGRNVSELICVTKTIFNNSHDLLQSDVISYRDIDQQQLRIGYWKKRSNEKIEILLDEIKKSQGHVILVEMEDQDDRSDKETIDMEGLHHAYQSCWFSSFLSVHEKMKKIINYRDMLLKQWRKKYNIDVVIFSNDSNKINQINLLNLFTICNGIDINTNSSNCLAMGLVNNQNQCPIICVATKPWYDEKCLEVMKLF